MMKRILYGQESGFKYEKLDGNKLLWNTELIWNEEPQYIISYSFDRDGNILFQVELLD